MVVKELRISKILKYYEKFESSKKYTKKQLYRFLSSKET